MLNELDQTPEVLEKWRKTGLLTNVDEKSQAMVAWLLENQERHQCWQQKRVSNTLLISFGNDVKEMPRKQ
jgi:hypothetical protein